MAIENIANDLPVNLEKQGRDVSSQIQSFELARIDDDILIGNYLKFFVEDLKIEDAYVKIFKIESYINNLESKIIELEAKKQVEGSNKKKIKRKIKEKIEDVSIGRHNLEIANQQKNEICQRLNEISSNFSMFLAEVRKAYLLMLEIECCIIY